MKESGEGLVRGVRLVTPNSEDSAGAPKPGEGPRQQETPACGIISCADPHEACAWLCLAVRSAALRAAWGAATAEPPILMLPPPAQSDTPKRPAFIERLLEVVREQLPSVRIDEGPGDPPAERKRVIAAAPSPPPASPPERPPERPPASPPTATPVPPKEDEADEGLTREEISMLLGRDEPEESGR